MIRPSPTSSARQPWASRARIAADDRHQIGPRGEQGGVDAGVAGDLADPRRHQRDGRALGAVELVDGIGDGRRVGLLAGGDGGDDLARCGPGGGARRRRGPGASSSIVAGWRWEMPRTARSGSTWRTGVSLAAASFRHAATAWATDRVGLAATGVLELSQATSGSVAPVGRVRSSSQASSTQPSRPSVRSSVDEAVVQLEERGDVGGGVLAAGRP